MVIGDRDKKSIIIVRREPTAVRKLKFREGGKEVTFINRHSRAQPNKTTLSTVLFSTVQYITIQYSTVQYCSVHFITVQYKDKDKKYDNIGQ